MAKRLTQLLLITLILSLGFGQLLRFEIFGLHIFLHDILIIFLISILLLKQQGPTLLFPSWFKLILTGLIIGTIRALTLFPLSQLIIPALYSLRLITYLAFYLFISHKPYAISRKPFIIAGLISLASGLSQYFLMPDMRIFQHLGWDDHLSRLTLPHFDPTFSAAFLSLSLLFLLPHTVRYSLFIALHTIGILFTYSRSIWLSLILTAMIFIKKKAVFLLAISCMLFAIFALPQKFGEGTNLLRTYSISSRITHDLDLAGRVGGNFIIGIGYNTLPLLLDQAANTPNHATSFNNSFLTILATSGVIGLIGWVIFLHSLYRKNKPLRPILIFLIIGSFFNNLLLYPFILLLLLLLTVPTEPSH